MVDGRLALGATQGDVMRAVLLEGMKPVLVGLLAGGAAAIAMATALRSPESHGMLTSGPRGMLPSAGGMQAAAGHDRGAERVVIGIGGSRT